MELTQNESNPNNPARGIQSVEKAVFALQRGSDTNAPKSAGGKHGLTGGNAKAGVAVDGRSEKAVPSTRTPLDKFRQLTGYAKANQLVLMGPFLKRIVGRHTHLGEGSEHTVYHFKDTTRVIKLTHVDEVGDGMLIGGVDVDGYLRSLLLSNNLLGMDTRFEGLVSFDGRTLPQIVTTQELVKDAKDATPGQIAKDLKRRGFTQAEDGTSWSHPVGVKIADVVPRNVLVSADGTLHYIDVYASTTQPIDEVLVD